MNVHLELIKIRIDHNFAVRFIKDHSTLNDRKGGKSLSRKGTFQRTRQIVGKQIVKRTSR